LKRFVLLILALVCFQVAHGKQGVSVTKGHQIIGTWKFDIPGIGCAETYRFFANGTTLVTSGEEIAESVYEISSQPSLLGFYKIVDTITKDNGGRDCMGEATAPGHRATNYIQFNATGNSMIMCQSENMDNCFGPIKKIPE
jgi:hypothetical protein